MKNVIDLSYYFETKQRVARNRRKKRVIYTLIAATLFFLTLKIIF